MPWTTYLPEEMGTATVSPSGPVVAGSWQELTLVYTAGRFGIDDSGMLKVSWRTTSDMAKPQFKDPRGPGFTTVVASNRAELDHWIERSNIRPWIHTINIRVGRGFLRAGDTITVRMGDRSGGSPGLRMQTNCEERFQLKTYVDAFATYEFAEVTESPWFELVAGPAATWKAIVPSLVVAGEPFRLAIVAEDMWGNPASPRDVALDLSASLPVDGLPATVTGHDDAPVVIEGLRAREAGDLDIRLVSASGAPLGQANPSRVVAQAPALRRYWGDLHAQSGETVGTNPARSYFAYARDRAFVDMVGHQGNDFQISDAFWAHLNELTAEFDVPGRFVCVPGYEWSGNTGMGGDRNVFYRYEGRPIRRSSRILVTDEGGAPDCYTAGDLFRAMEGEDAVVIAHVGGRYADLNVAHDGRLERSVEVHSSWGTFEWLLHDALALGARVGIVCHSDDHKGRPGATRPGASSFGALGGLTCYLMPSLDRESLFTALRRRHHYGSTGNRPLIELTGRFATPVAAFHDDPALGPADSREVTEVTMGDIVQPGPTPMRLSAEVIGTAPIERVDVMHGTAVAQTVRPFAEAHLGRRVRILWEGAEYRGRGRETLWKGTARLSGNRISRFAEVNFINPERKVVETMPGTALAWTSVTTGNRAGIDLWLEDGMTGTLEIETDIVSATVDLSRLGAEAMCFDGGGLGRALSVYRLPDEDWTRHVTVEHEVTFIGGADLPVYLRLTQADGHQAWTSPIYLIRSGG